MADNVVLETVKSPLDSLVYNLLIDTIDEFDPKANSSLFLDLCTENMINALISILNTPTKGRDHKAGKFLVNLTDECTEKIACDIISNDYFLSRIDDDDEYVRNCILEILRNIIKLFQVVPDCLLDREFLTKILHLLRANFDVEAELISVFIYELTINHCNMEEDTGQTIIAIASKLISHSSEDVLSNTLWSLAAIKCPNYLKMVNESEVPSHLTRLVKVEGSLIKLGAISLIKRLYDEEKDSQKQSVVALFYETLILSSYLEIKKMNKLPTIENEDEYFHYLINLPKMFLKINQVSLFIELMYCLKKFYDIDDEDFYKKIDFHKHFIYLFDQVPYESKEWIELRAAYNYISGLRSKEKKCEKIYCEMSQSLYEKLHQDSAIANSDRFNKLVLKSEMKIKIF